MSARAVGIIPARFGSTRFPGKPLKMILDKPLLQWVVEGARTSKLLSEVVVATDHPDIMNLCEKIKVRGVMTDSNLPSGSDRVWAAAENINADIVLNVQGDEPLIEGSVLDKLVQTLTANPEIEMATLARKLRADDLTNQSVAKIAVNKNNEALLFSRLGIPFSRQTVPANCEFAYRHIGIYGYRKPFLKRYCQTGRVELEMAEDLEQLRALYMGAKIKVVVVDHEAIGVDTPSDIQKAEALLKKRG